MRCCLQNVAGKFQRGRIDMLTIEAVDIGDIRQVDIKVMGQTDKKWVLERVRVKKYSHGEQEAVFNYDRWVHQDLQLLFVRGVTALKSKILQKKYCQHLFIINTLFCIFDCPYLVFLGLSLTTLLSFLVRC